MITSAENRAWTGDVHLDQSYREAGLPAPSVIRPCKIATIETRHAEPLGRIDPDRLLLVLTALRDHLAVPRR